MPVHISQLLDLQELDIVLAEARIVHDNERTGELEQKIADLRASIDTDTLARYDRVRQQEGSSVVPIKSGMCMGCHLGVPQGDLNRMKSEKMSPNCPNCGRFLVLS
jgi:predicted  nucleic acid-binding Zn-ribbon protein